MHERVTEFLAVIIEPKESRLIGVISEFFPELSFMPRERHYLTGIIFLLQEGGNIDLIRGKAPSEIGPIVSQQVDATMADFIRGLETLLPVCRDMGAIQRGLIFINAVKQQIAGIPLIQEMLKLLELMSGFILECVQRLKNLFRTNEETFMRIFRRSNYFRFLDGMSIQDVMASMTGMIRSVIGLNLPSLEIGSILNLANIDGPE